MYWYMMYTHKKKTTDVASLIKELKSVCPYQSSWHAECLAEFV